MERSLDHTGRLVKALQRLRNGTEPGTVGVLLEVITKYPDGRWCGWPKYDIYFCDGKTIRLEEPGTTFDFVD